MFKSRCLNCDKKISKKFEFCPYCGANTNSKNSQDYGFLGNEADLDLPLGFKLMLKPLLKELNKQMSQMDKEMKNNKTKQDNFSSFSVHIGIPGQQPIKINNINNGKSFEKVLQLPKADKDVLGKMQKLPRKEAVTNIRRLADRVIYEIDLPKVDSLKSINITELENGFELKALSGKEVFVKSLNLNLPFINYYLQDGKFFMEFAIA